MNPAKAKLVVFIPTSVKGQKIPTTFQGKDDEITKASTFYKGHAMAS